MGQITAPSQRSKAARCGKPTTALCLSTIPHSNPYKGLRDLGTSTATREKEWATTRIYLETWYHCFPPQFARRLCAGHQTRLLGGSKPQAYQTHGHHARSTGGRPLPLAQRFPHNIKVAAAHQDGTNSRRTLSDRPFEKVPARIMSWPLTSLSESRHIHSS